MSGEEDKPPFRASTYKDAYERELEAGTALDTIHDQAVRNVLTTLPYAVNVALDKLEALEAQLSRIEAQLCRIEALLQGHLQSHEAGGQ